MPLRILDVTNGRCSGAGSIFVSLHYHDIEDELASSPYARYTLLISRILHLNVRNRNYILNYTKDFHSNQFLPRNAKRDRDRHLNRWGYNFRHRFSHMVNCIENYVEFECGGAMA